jgi:hypothetical protein
MLDGTSGSNRERLLMWMSEAVSEFTCNVATLR